VNAADPDAVRKVRELTRGGVDYALEMAGSAKALELAYHITRRGGTTVTAGLANPAHAFSIPAVSLTAEERTIKGSYVGSCIPSRDVPRYVALFRKGRLPVDRLTSERVGFDGLNAAFDRLADGDTVRQILLP
jgi:alcohol dehydrogenase